MWQADCKGNAGTATISFVTTKPDFKYNVKWNADWITGYKETKSVVLPTSAEHPSTGTLYTIDLTLTANCQSAAQSGIVTITSGDLSREVEIKQLGYDFRTDPNRTVQIRGLDGLTSKDEADYFFWMDSKLKGITPEENQGRVRDDGLHFFVGNNTVYYLIPKLQGDELTCNDTRVTVDKKSVNGFYKVTLADNSPNNYKRWISDEAFTIITITNARTKITVTYPVYHVGLFAHLTGKAATDYQLGKSKASGWYYYEMVDVVAKVTKKMELPTTRPTTCSTATLVPQTTATILLPQPPLKTT